MNILARKRLADTAVNLAEPLNLRILRHRLRLIDQLLEEFAGEDAVVPPAGSFAHQEHAGLVSDLRAARSTTVNAIATTSAPNLTLRERNEAFLGSRRAKRTRDQTFVLGATVA